jgi:hypothetical protein
MRFSTSAFPDNGPKKTWTSNSNPKFIPNSFKIQGYSLKVYPPSICPPLSSLYPSFYPPLPLSLYISLNPSLYVSLQGVLIVDRGEGDRLLSFRSADAEVQTFISSVPALAAKIRNIFTAIREGSLGMTMQQLGKY